MDEQTIEMWEKLKEEFKTSEKQMSSEEWIQNWNDILKNE